MRKGVPRLRRWCVWGEYGSNHVILLGYANGEDSWGVFIVLFCFN